MIPTLLLGMTARLATSRASERPVQRVREGLLLTRSVRRGAAGLDAGTAKTVHEIPDRETFANALCRIYLAPRVDDDDALGYEERRERDVGRHCHVARLGVFRDVPVGNVGPTVHAHGRQVFVAERKLHALIGHEDSLEQSALGGPKADFLHVARGGVGIEPKLH